MVKITITHEDGSVHEYEDIVAFDFYDREFCESIAGREMSEEELNEVQNAMDQVEDVTSDSVSQVINEIIRGEQ